MSTASLWRATLRVMSIAFAVLLGVDNRPPAEHPPNIDRPGINTWLR